MNSQQISHSSYGNNRRYVICILAVDEKNRMRERQGKSVEGRGEYFARQEMALLLDNLRGLLRNYEGWHVDLLSKVTLFIT